MSKKSTSQDRHGRIFTDDFREQTIRAVTPESPSNSPGMAPESGAANSLSPHSPLPYPSGRFDATGGAREHEMSNPTTDEEPTVDTRRRRRRPKSKTKEAENAPQESSPNSFMTKTRQRLGSITVSGSGTPKGPEDPTGSIGFPSIIQSPPLLPQREARQRLTKSPPRTASPPAADESQRFGKLHGALMDPDTRKISSLMKITSGRMAGILFFRTDSSAPWASGYCAINVASGSLIYQPNVRNPANSRDLIPNLRGCSVRTLFDAETQGTYLKVATASPKSGVQLRPAVPETFDSWLAALLCWQPISPDRMDNKMNLLESETPRSPERNFLRKITEIDTKSSLSVIKMAKLWMWNGSRSSDVLRGSSRRRRVSSYRPSQTVPPPWHVVNCTLHENGLLKLYSDHGHEVLTTVYLAQLSRSAVQQLDASVLAEEFCIAIYPQYSTTVTSRPFRSPIYLACDTRITFEVWFVLLRAFAVPELFRLDMTVPQSPPSRSPEEQTIWESSHRSDFRVERSLSLRIMDVRFRSSASMIKGGKATKAHPENIYAEVFFDNSSRARTTVKPDSATAVWGEDFQFSGLAALPSSVDVLVEVQNPAEKEWTMTARGAYDLTKSNHGSEAVSGDIEVSSHDAIFGKIQIPTRSLRSGLEIEQRWPIRDNVNRSIGDMLLKICPEEIVVLMSSEYAPLSQLLHKFANGLAVELAKILSGDLLSLSNVLLDIFQVSGDAGEWLMYLVEEEIDGVQRELPPSRRLRYSSRIQSGDSGERGETREILMRDLGRSATVEANLLFRGNSLLTKALDAHMRRLGREYLEETLGASLRDIAESNPDCEVDPSKLKSRNDIDRNWRNLITLTSAIWNAIAGSASRCPPELRLLFRHIQSCAHDRYGDWIRSVRFSSVSGFLFLRFFCPAILNPKLFGLLKGMF